MSPDEYLEHFKARVLQDALAEALPIYWERRAQQFEWAISREGDHCPDPEAQAGRDAELERLAGECRRRAHRRADLDAEWWAPLIEEVLGESPRA